MYKHKYQLVKSQGMSLCNLNTAWIDIYKINWPRKYNSTWGAFSRNLLIAFKDCSASAWVSCSNRRAGFCVLQTQKRETPLQVFFSLHHSNSNWLESFRTSKMKLTTIEDKRLLLERNRVRYPLMAPLMAFKPEWEDTFDHILELIHLFEGDAEHIQKLYSCLLGEWRMAERTLLAIILASKVREFPLVSWVKTI